MSKTLRLRCSSTSMVSVSLSRDLGSRKAVFVGVGSNAVMPRSCCNSIGRMDVQADGPQAPWARAFQFALYAPMLLRSITKRGLTGSTCPRHLSATDYGSRRWSIRTDTAWNSRVLQTFRKRRSIQSRRGFSCTDICANTEISEHRYSGNYKLRACSPHLSSPLARKLLTSLTKT